MIEKIKNLEISEKEKTELKWWLDNGLQEIYEYLENWKFETDTSEKFTDPKVCCICGKPNSKRVDGKYYCSKHEYQVRELGGIQKFTIYTPNEYRILDKYVRLVVRNREGSQIIFSLLMILC